MWAAMHTGISSWLPDHPLAAVLLGTVIGFVAHALLPARK